MRRRILTALMTDNPRFQDEFLTEEFRPAGTDPETASITLYHQHLPHLEQAGFVEVESETGRVTRGEDFEDVRPILERLYDRQDELPEDWP